MDKFPKKLKDEFQDHMAPRYAELSDIHVGQTAKPQEDFALKIGGTVTHETIAKAHDARPVLHPDREW